MLRLVTHPTSDLDSDVKTGFHAVHRHLPPPPPPTPPSSLQPWFLLLSPLFSPFFSSPFFFSLFSECGLKAGGGSSRERARTFRCDCPSFLFALFRLSVPLLSLFFRPIPPPGQPPILFSSRFVLTGTSHRAARHSNFLSIPYAHPFTVFFSFIIAHEYTRSRGRTLTRAGRVCSR